MVGQLKNLICTEQSRFYVFSQPREFKKLCSITSEYFSFFNNKPPVSWVVYVTRDFLRCYSCSYYTSINCSYKLVVCLRYVLYSSIKKFWFGKLRSIFVLETRKMSNLTLSWRRPIFAPQINGLRFYQLLNQNEFIS